MRKYLATIIALFLLLGSMALAQAKASVHTKILFHDHQEVRKGFGTAGWLILADINNGGKVLSVAGLRYNSQNKPWWVEVMGGGVVGKNAGGQMDKMWLVDVRISPPPLGKHFTHWTNLEWVDIPKVKVGRYYVYYQINANLPLGLGKVGVETENTLKPGKDSLSFGPHLVLAVGKSMKVSFVYQWHRKFEGNQWWFRSLFDF